MENINDVCDYVIFRVKSEDDTSLSNLKLQKLLYYTQAWHLAFHSKKLFEGDFQAWIHGPVNREIFERFKQTKSIYSEITIEDILNNTVSDKLNSPIKEHIDTILESYAKFSGTQLEYMAHNEEPWLSARIGLSNSDRCEQVIDEKLMETYYKSRLS
jgi:uncharacterized phage-associated protein